MYLRVVGTNIRMLGTLHLFPATKPEVPDWAWRAYNASEAILYETDHEAEAAHRFLPPGQSLDKVLPPRVWTILASAAQSPEDLETMTRLLPAYAAFQHVFRLMSVAPGIEVAYRTRAVSDGKKQFYLEQPGFQSSLLSSIPIELISDLILGLDPPAASDSLVSMHTSWLAWDWQRLLETSFHSPLFRNATLRNILLDRRNSAWMEFVRPALEANVPVLIAVGVLHLIGQGSLTALLQEQGYEIEILNNERS